MAERAQDADTFLTPAQRDKAMTAGPLMLDMLRRAHAAQIKIAVDGDLTHNISLLRDVRFVMARGTMVKE